MDVVWMMYGLAGQVDGEGMANTCLTRFLCYLQLYGRLAQRTGTFNSNSDVTPRDPRP